MQTIDSYESKQKDGVNILTNAIAGVATGLIAIGTGGIGLGVIGAGAAIGAGSKVALKTIDRATNEVEGDEIDLKEMTKDAVTGAVDGAVNIATGGMVGKVGTTLTKSIMNGAIQGAKAGAISGAAGGAAEYTADVLVGDREFSANELVTTTISNAAVGGVFGGVVGGITGGIKHSKTNTPDAPKASDASCDTNVSTKEPEIQEVGKVNNNSVETVEDTGALIVADDKAIDTSNTNQTPVASAIEPEISDSFDASKVKLARTNARNLPEPDLCATIGREWNTADLEAFLKQYGKTLDDYDNEFIQFLKEVEADPETSRSFYDYIFDSIKEDTSITQDTVFYHGTTAEAKEAIIQNGFDLSKNINHESGKGVYTVTYEPSSDYIYGDGTIVKMVLSSDKKVAKLPGGIASKIKNAEFAYLASFNQGIQNNRLFAQSTLVQDSIIRQLRKLGYSGITTSTVNAGVPYTVIWDPSDLKIIA